jgi:hypothetical protein
MSFCVAPQIASEWWNIEGRSGIYAGKRHFSTARTVRSLSHFVSGEIGRVPLDCKHKLLILGENPAQLQRNYEKLQIDPGCIDIEITIRSV